MKSDKSGPSAKKPEESIWLTQKMMGVLYDVNVRTVNEHLKKIFADSELREDSVIRKFRITASDGKSYNTQHYKLPAIIAVGYKVSSERAVQFRKWATSVIEQFTIKAYVMDDERIKAGGSVLTEQYFEEQLQRIREIRISERKFYQKIARCGRMQARSRRKSPRPMPKASLKSTASCRIACLRAISTGYLSRLRLARPRPATRSK
jgi:hypothetical protein